MTPKKKFLEELHSTTGQKKHTKLTVLTNKNGFYNISFAVTITVVIIISE